MKYVAAVLAAIAVLVVLYLIARGPMPGSPAQAEARAAVDSLQRERVAALARGDRARWARAFAPEARFVPSTQKLFPIAPDRAAEMLAREPGADRLDDTSHTASRIGTARKAKLAWTVTDAGRGATSAGPEAMPMRITTAWMRDGGAWTVILEHHSLPTSGSDDAWRVSDVVFPAIRSDSAYQRAYERLQSIFVDRPHPMVRRFLRQLGHLSDVRVDPEAMVIGPSDGEFASGDSAVKALLGDWEHRYGALVADRATMVSWTPRRAGVGWVVADLTAKPTGVEGPTLRLRMSAVYRERGEDSYTLVLAHLCDPAAGAVAAPDSAGPTAVRMSVAPLRRASAARTSSQPAPVARSATSTW
jgi:hypothetical protein